MHTAKMIGSLVTLSLVLANCSSTTQPITTPTVTAPTQSVSTSAPISYKTYTDPSIAFSFDYPATWRVEKDSNKHVFSIINPVDEIKCTERKSNPIGGDDGAFECSPVVTIAHSQSPQELIKTIGSQKVISDFNALLDYRLDDTATRENIMFLGSTATAGQLNDMGGGMVILQQSQQGIVEVIFHNKADAWKESMKDFNEVEKHILNSFRKTK